MNRPPPPLTITPSPNGWQVIACDLDGTLLGRNNALHPDDIDALRRARSAGLHVAICTGRNTRECDMVVQPLGLTGPGVFVNGAVVGEMSTGQSLVRRTMPFELVDRLVDFFGGLGHAVLALADDPLSRLPIYLRTQHGPPHRATLEWLVAHQVHSLVQPTIEPALRGHIVRTGIVVDVPEAGPIEAALHQRFADRVYAYSVFAAVYQCQVIDVFDHGTTKWAGIETMCRMLGADPARVVTIGDDVNDLPMLENAALSFAMANAASIVRNAAKATTAPQAQAGVARVVHGILDGKY